MLWPLLLRWVLQRAAPRGSLVNWLLLVFVAAIVNRCLLYMRFEDPYRLSFGTDTQADSLVLGCASAIALGAASMGWPGLWAAIGVTRATRTHPAPLPGGEGGSSAPDGTARTSAESPSDRTAAPSSLGEDQSDVKAHPDNRKLVTVFRGRVRSVLGWCAAASLAGLLWKGVAIPWRQGVEECLGYPLIAALGTLTVVGVVVSPGCLLCRLLSNGCLVWVGRISYGLYLWHSPIFLETQLRRWPFWRELSVELGVTMAVVLASYYALERPLLRLKTRLAPLGQAA